MTTPQHPPVTASPLALGRLFGGATGRRVTGVSLVVLAAYVGTIVTANWASTHWSALLVGAVAVPAGTLWAGTTFTLRDLMHECLGPQGVLAAIAAGAGLSWLLASPQIAMASVLAFTVSELVGSIVYGRPVRSLPTTRCTRARGSGSRPRQASAPIRPATCTRRERSTTSTSPLATAA